MIFVSTIVELEKQKLTQKEIGSLHSSGTGGPAPAPPQGDQPKRDKCLDLDEGGDSDPSAKEQQRIKELGLQTFNAGSFIFRPSPTMQSLLEAAYGQRPPSGVIPCLLSAVVPPFVRHRCYRA